MNAISDFTHWTDVGAVTDIPLRGARRVRLRPLSSSGCARSP